MKRLLSIIYLLLLISWNQSYSQTPTVSMSNQTALPGNSISYPIIASGFLDLVGAVTIYVLIDTNTIKCTGYTPGILVGDLAVNYQVNPISISWYYANGLNINGTLITLNFKYRGGTSVLDFTSGCEIAKASPPDIITVNWIDGTIGPKPTTTYYVDSAVVSSGNGLSWATALKKISEATNKPLAAGDNVFIKPCHYTDTVVIKSNGNEIVPLTFNVTVSDTNKITFPVGTDLGSIDIADYPGEFYAYLCRSWKGNNGVFKIIQVNKTSRYVIVDGGAFVPESGAASDSSLLQAAVGFPVNYEKYSTNPQVQRVTLSSSGITGERAALHIGRPTSAGDFNVNAANYNMINGIDVTGADQVGVRIQNSKFNVYKNSRIYELDSIGLMISGNTAKPANNNFILNNTIYNTKKKAIKIGIQGETAANNKANLNHIKGNEIYSTTGANINYINAIDVCHYTNFTVIESNTIRNFKLSEINRGVIELKNSVRKVLAYSNFIKNIDRVNASNTHSIFYLMNNGNNNKVYNNVIVDSAALANDIFAFWVNGNGGYTAGLIAYNSVHKVDNGFRLESGTPNVDFQIKNNIMNLDATTPEQYNTSGTGTYTVSYNCYSTTPGSYAGETGRLVTDPVYLLPGNYLSPYALSLQTSSPCLNSGNPITGVVTDFRRKTRNSSTPSRGAFEQVLSNFYWTGDMNTNWYDYRNWDVKMVPSSVYNAIIPDRSNDPLISTGSASCKSLQVQAGALLKVQPPATITVYP
jgi:hypothetical protein